MRFAIDLDITVRKSIVYICNVCEKKSYMCVFIPLKTGIENKNHLNSFITLHTYMCIYLYIHTSGDLPFTFFSSDFTFFLPSGTCVVRIHTVTDT